MSGTCSGTPLPCSGLTTDQCALTSGCTDRGTCAGVATSFGDTCATQLDPRSCALTPGCYWATKCEGTPLATCNAFSAGACLSALGCVWTPALPAVPGGACALVGAPCTSISDCGCGLDCVLPCPGCARMCELRGP